MKIEIIKGYIDRFTNESVKVGTILEVTDERAAEIIAKGKAIEVKEHKIIKAKKK